MLACLMAVSASSALAVSIEPLNTKFETTSEHGSLKVGSGTKSSEWSCEAATIAGKTNSTKTNFVNVTPTVGKCRTTISNTEHTLTWVSSCKTEGTVPWTLTLTEGTGPFTGTTKFNCPATLTIDAGAACVVDVSEQTVANHLEWTTLKASEPFESALQFEPGAIKYKGTGPSKGALCGVFAFSGESGGSNLSLTEHFATIKGIKAV